MAKQTGKEALAGNPYALGMAIGAVGSMAIPGAGEAEAVEDAARVGKLGEVGAEAAAKVPETAGAEVAAAATESELESASKEARALEGDRLPEATIKKEGWPDLPARQAPNFVYANPVTLDPGEKIYRIIDDPANAGGGYWARELPPSLSDWRSGYAVRPEWNSNGLYTEHTIQSPLNVWEGSTAGQGSLVGGKDQIWMPPGTLNPTNISPTGW